VNQQGRGRCLHQETAQVSVLPVGGQGHIQKPDSGGFRDGHVAVVPRLTMIRATQVQNSLDAMLVDGLT